MEIGDFEILCCVNDEEQAEGGQVGCQQLEQKPPLHRYRNHETGVWKKTINKQIDLAKNYPLALPRRWS